jgi:hypothetical protein
MAIGPGQFGVEVQPVIVAVPIPEIFTVPIPTLTLALGIRPPKVSFLIVDVSPRSVTVTKAFVNVTAPILPETVADME